MFTCAGRSWIVLTWTRVPVSLIIYRHVAGFVTLDALDEVLHGLLNIAICIIRTPKFNLLERNAQLSHKFQVIRGLQASCCDAPHLDVLRNDFRVITD